MPQGFLKYKGLYGDNQPGFVSDFIHIEPLAIRSKIYAWEISEHIHTDLFQVFLIQKGEGVLVSEKKELRIQGPCILVIPPNILHGFTFDATIKGDVITLSNSFLYTLFKDRPNLQESLQQLNRILLEANSPIFKDFLYLKNKIQEEIFEEHPEKSLAMQSYFQLFFVALFRCKLEAKRPEIVHTNRALGYFRQFQQLIKQSAQQPLSIKAYADQLHITQMHLNRICHVVANTTALKVVQDFTITEAKKYLLNTSYSISEIAYFLNFNDPAYFSRLFKKRVGVAPGEFRKG
ncbi:helix-turn-helix domain-containing protein [Maribacter sp. CXY002]|uniref:helix-turn-helix domain-containing protein n=1 Tax=Maribacter luteocoastalis TaxID=3407671 RepID=UPI003B67D636